MIVMLTAINAQAACSWLCCVGTVQEKITLASRTRYRSGRCARKNYHTSEGQSYAMFLPRGETIDRRSRNCLTDAKHLAQGSLREHRPPGWGKDPDTVGAGQQLRVRTAISGWHGRCLEAGRL